MQSPLLQATHLHKSFSLQQKKLEILRGVSLSIDAGELVFITGASGAGKTTLLYTLAGLEKPDSGEVIFRGTSLYQASGRTQARLRNRSMGYIFQNYQLLPDLSALENVLLPLWVRGSGSRARAEQLLDRVGLAQRAEHLPGELSGGEQQRVAIARALVNDPEILFADEPTGNLDSATGQRVMQLLLELVREEGKTLLVVTHELGLVDAGAGVQRHWQMHDGVLLES